MRDPGKPQISQVPALAVAHSPTAIPAENQAPKIALRLSPRRCSKARQSWPGFRPATLLPFWNLDTGLGLAMELCILCTTRPKVISLLFRSRIRSCYPKRILRFGSINHVYFQQYEETNGCA